MHPPHGCQHTPKEVIPISVTEVHRALGSFSIQLNPDTPQWIVDLLDTNRFGHIAIDSGRDVTMGDQITGQVRAVIYRVRGSGRTTPTYRLGDTGVRFADGRPREAVVEAAFHAPTKAANDIEVGDRLVFPAQMNNRVEFPTLTVKAILEYEANRLLYWAEPEYGFGIIGRNAVARLA